MSSRVETGGTKLLGRLGECDALDRLLEAAHAGTSRVTVLRGDAGVGKSALLAYVEARVAGWYVAKAVGVESEMELTYSGLHQLCAPMFDGLDGLPDPQRRALATVFGLDAGPAPDRFLVGLGTLTLFAEVAEKQPLVCIVDDAHWLDDASTQVLGFVARRLLAERIAVVCAARTGAGDTVLSGLPELVVSGLGDSDARALLLDRVHGPLDAAVCAQIIAESRGNPLALIELSRAPSAADLAGGFGFPATHPVAGKIQQSYAKRLLLLPRETQLLVLAAAAEPLGDLELLRRAADVLDVDMTAARPAVDAGLLEIGTRVEFAHPLVRSAAYGSAATDDRHRVHRALAEATDGSTEPDRRAWHRAQSRPGPDETVAFELERSASRAQARGGVGAAAAFLERSLALTDEPALRAGRALAAGRASLRAGNLDKALTLARTADGSTLDEPQRAAVDLLRAQILFAQDRASDGPALLLQAAERFEDHDVDVARDIYLDALSAGVLLGRMTDGVNVDEIARRALAAPKRVPSRASDLLLDGFARRFTDGYAAAVPYLREAVAAYVLMETPGDEDVRRLWLASHAAWHLWDDRSWQRLAARHVEHVRAAGALADLPFALSMRSAVHIAAGELEAAESLNHERRTITDAIRSRFPPFADFALAAWSGAGGDAWNRDQWGRAGLLDWMRAVRFNSHGRYDDGLLAAMRATESSLDIVASNLGLLELVLAAVRCGDDESAASGIEQLSRITSAAGTNWALGVRARAHALLGGENTEALYREALELLAGTLAHPETARTHLLFGEWLRREGRRIAAREQLGTAYEMLTAMGMHAFAELARRELAATGATARRRTEETRGDLTPQEAQIAQLAREGYSNPEIATQLFLSPRTVEWHLRKVFTKLDIGSRKELNGALATAGEAMQPR